MIQPTLFYVGLTTILLASQSVQAGHHHHSGKHGLDSGELPPGYQVQIVKVPPVANNTPSTSNPPTVPTSTSDVKNLKFKLSARNLPSKDKFMNADPYVVITLSEKKVKGERQVGQTAVIKDSLNPNWGDVFKVTYIKGNQQFLHFAIWDKDTIFDDKIGEVDLKLGDYLRGGEFTQMHLKKKGLLIIEKA